LRYTLVLLLFPMVIGAQTFKKCIRPYSTGSLPAEISETSGLVAFEGMLITHNDSGNAPNLYFIDTTTYKIAKQFKLPVPNRDWEDITQDSSYFYLADVGNNYHKRSLLHIYRIDKKALLRDKIVLDSISFKWPADLISGKVVHYNCEALVASSDSLYLFTKEEGRISAFSLPKLPGLYEARYKDSLKSPILITGAYFNEAANRLVLCGYNKMMRPSLYDFRDFKNHDFFSGKVTKIRIRKRFRQVEGITSFNGKDFYLASEHFRVPMLINKKQQVHRLLLE